MARTKAYDREVVLEVVTRAFLEKGYESTSMADLMAVTGLNKKSLYNEFGNKEALFLQVLDAFVSKERQVLSPILTTEPLGFNNIRRAFDYLFTTFSETGCLLALSLNEASCISEQALRFINASLLSIEEGFKVNLSHALSNEMDAQAYARNLLALMQGYTSLTRSPALREPNLASLNFLLDQIEYQVNLAKEN
ncbi:TetR/AcrR family transcriptional regulator [Catenovulum sp. SM1970]|uniref:TetR/AcrR family transcriptional regulator n=1 Tax=Marinifaba aquimaris TaxID=2741323 RepID=UPI001571FA9B|nr:TetR/AcrR family transcriptional regulator [Marinifaba aquimaris]NTS75287.1 TetR/AcrR family transcriptional regulator [Marinifaba aquimaris]